VPLDDDPLTSPSFPAINTSDSRSYRARRSSGAHSGPQTGPQPAASRAGGFAEPAAQYPLQPPVGQRPVAQPPVGPPSVAQPQTPMAQPVANPYGSYVSASQPSYQDVAASRRDVPAYGGGYANGQHADAAGYSGAATGYLPANGHLPTNGHNGNGYAARDHDVADGYGAVDYQNLTYQDVDYQPAPPVTDGYAPQNQHAGQYDRGYGAPDLAYGQDGYQGYPGYGPGSR
jgi:hypothetical protein